MSYRFLSILIVLVFSIQSSIATESVFVNENTEFSEDRKTITYKASWLQYLADSKLLDLEVEFEDE
ncbi:MAG: hypothetical protein HKN00_04680 [Flavobacteriaceae bacterium]|nr:hypothetical protein [Bacteroidia bacterium]MBT8288611.1 hypothetical protein [Bacteroidia bacterium]NNF74457.1 hypothetical protein [Flavobacteriaceae bacterium]NNK74358.1 hypothetical protein [Flavobacteriaceae bacterium]NNL80223.1 hypothetical protein [Flavobacteriaceae bacterium]